jgi:hypothetical protein
MIHIHFSRSEYLLVHGDTNRILRNANKALRAEVYMPATVQRSIETAFFFMVGASNRGFLFMTSALPEASDLQRLDKHWRWRIVANGYTIALIGALRIAI